MLFDRLIVIVVFVVVMIGLIGFTDLPIGGEPPRSYEREILSGSVERVVDGDTLRISGQTRAVRLWGIDAPEISEAGGSESSRNLASLVSGQKISCKKKDEDRYGRIVALCHSTSGVDLAEAQIASGHAVEWLRYSRGYYSGSEPIGSTDN